MIYFMRQVSTGYIKIGYSGLLWERQSALQAEFGSIVVIGLMPGELPQEQALHRALVKYGLRQYVESLPFAYNSEWYYPHPDLISYLTDRTDIELVCEMVKQSDRGRFGYLRREKMEWLATIPDIPYRNEVSHKRALTRYLRMRNQVWLPPDEK